MVRIKVDGSVLVIERRLGLLKRNAVFPLVGPVLLLVPSESEAFHTYSVSSSVPAIKGHMAADDKTSGGIRCP